MHLQIKTRSNSCSGKIELSDLRTTEQNKYLECEPLVYFKHNYGPMSYPIDARASHSRSTVLEYTTISYLVLWLLDQVILFGLSAYACMRSIPTLNGIYDCARDGKALYVSSAA